jgi:dolichol-phosphate mannosyltransferase
MGEGTDRTGSDLAGPSSSASPTVGEEAIRLHIVVPVFNEGANFPAFYRSVKANIRTPHRMIVVYDFEEDDTLPCVRELQRTDDRLHLVKNPDRGVLGALKKGLRVPQDGAILVSMADLSDDHARADSMFALYDEGCDVVAASRYIRGGSQVGGPWLKRTLSRLAGVSLHYLGGLPTCDPTNNYKLYSARLIQQVEIESTGGFEVALELTVKAHRLGMAIGEVPARWTDRAAGKSRFQMVKWLPCYLRWYLGLLRFRLENSVGRK